MKQQYIKKNIAPKKRRLIEQINDIINEYYPRYTLTVRQIHYQLVARGLIRNTPEMYRSVVGACGDGRLLGLIDWDAIEDRTRGLQGNTHWENPVEMARAAHRSYYRNKWEGQQYYIECWVEKQALESVLARACRPLDINFMSCRGYMSLSEMREAADRFNTKLYDGYECVLFHLGDHDPSGIDMTRDNIERLEMFLADVKVERLALNYDQVEQYDAPPDFAKKTDSRFKSYAIDYGNESWELDALPPDVLVDIVTQAVLPFRDNAIYQDILEVEEREKAILGHAIQYVIDLVEDMD